MMPSLELSSEAKLSAYLSDDHRFSLVCVASR
jgi:hypothetical protein